MGHLHHIADRIAGVSPAWEAQIQPISDAAERIASDLGDDHIALGVETIREGYLLHHRTPRTVNPASTDDRVLIGDHCFATGLVEVAASGDLAAVRTLAKLVADISAAGGDHTAHDRFWTEALAALRETHE